jgi:hypothetical protein
MRIRIISMTIAIIGLNFTIVGCIQNASERRAASPTIAERLKQDSVTGKVRDLSQVVPTGAHRRNEEGPRGRSDKNGPGTHR